MFDKLFEEAEKHSLESFTDADLRREGIVVPQLTELDVAMEGFIRAAVGDTARGFSAAYKEMKGWTLGIESKRKYINEQCLDSIEWLRDEDRENKNLDLDMGRFKTWLKTSEFREWRFYFVLSDQVFNDIMSQLKKNEITTIEAITDFDMKERMRVGKVLDSVTNIKDLVVVMEKYRSRCNLIFEGLLKRKRRLQSFPFQILLLGYVDLNKTCKRIVNLAT